MRLLKLILAAAVVPLLVAIGATYLLANNNSSPTSTEPMAGPDIPDAISTRVVPAATAAAVRLADRSDCGVIRGTEYYSDAEQQWYIANCVPTPDPPHPPAIPGAAVAGERWILIDLTHQTTTAMIGDTPLYTALATTGKEEWETPVGTFYILRRVENETMTSVSIGAEEYYELKNVLYTQYFTNVGHAIHLNYWRPDDYFGSIPSSHGCVGLRMTDAEFFWNFARVGTRVTIV